MFKIYSNLIQAPGSQSIRASPGNTSAGRTSARARAGLHYPPLLSNHYLLAPKGAFQNAERPYFSGKGATVCLNRFDHSQLTHRYQECRR